MPSTTTHFVKLTRLQFCSESLEAKKASPATFRGLLLSPVYYRVKYFYGTDWLRASFYKCVYWSVFPFIEDVLGVGKNKPKLAYNSGEGEAQAEPRWATSLTTIHYCFCLFFGLGFSWGDIGGSGQVTKMIFINKLSWKAILWYIELYQYIW